MRLGDFPSRLRRVALGLLLFFGEEPAVAIDAYLVVKGVVGETLDEEFGPMGGCEISSFQLGVEKSSSLDEPDEEKEDEEEQKLSKQSAKRLDALGIDRKDRMTQLEGFVAKAFKKKLPPALKELENYTFEVTKDADSATPYFFMAYCETAAVKDKEKFKPYPEATVYLRKSGGGAKPQVFMKLIFREVYVVSFGMSATHSDDSTPDETVKFCFSECEFHYMRQSGMGGVKTGEAKPIILKFNFRTQKREVISEGKRSAPRGMK